MKKTFDCVTMKRRGAEKIDKQIAGMTVEQKLAYWQQRTDALKQRQRSIRNRHRKCGYLHKDYGGKKAGLHPLGPLLSDAWTDIHRIKHNKYRDEHPCQLPLHLLERIILMSTDEGDIVLDPFSGTGTTALAAKRLGRNFIGLELDEEYVRISESKLKQEKPDSKLGDVWVSFFLDAVVTIRDLDWPLLAPYYVVPKKLESIDHTPIAPRNWKTPAYTPKRNGQLQDLPMFTEK